MEPNAGLSSASQSKCSKSTRHESQCRHAGPLGGCSYSHAWLPSDTRYTSNCTFARTHTVQYVPSHHTYKHIHLQIWSLLKGVLVLYEYIRSRLAPFYLLPTKESPRGSQSVTTRRTTSLSRCWTSNHTILYSVCNMFNMHLISTRHQSLDNYSTT